MVRPDPVVVVPAFNESAKIKVVVETVADRFPVIVVDDASSDATGDIARSAGATVIRNDSNRGYQGSLDAGIRSALSMGYEWVITMDADGEHDPSLVSQFAKQLVEGRDLVLGVRPRKQRVSEIAMCAYVRIVYGPKDILCGMKGYSARLLNEVGSFGTGDSIGTSLALRWLARGGSFVEVVVFGKQREDRPRFDSVLRANKRIFAALLRQISIDLGQKRVADLRP